MLSNETLIAKGKTMTWYRAETFKEDMDDLGEPLDVHGLAMSKHFHQKHDAIE